MAPRPRRLDGGRRQDADSGWRVTGNISRNRDHAVRWIAVQGDRTMVADNVVS